MKTLKSLNFNFNYIVYSRERESVSFVCSTYDMNKQNKNATITTTKIRTIFVCYLFF